MRRLAFTLILAACTWHVAPHAQSSGPGVPRVMPASGVLFDTSGQPLDANNVRVTFSVYAGAEDEVALWSETLRLAITAGRYDALIGSSTPGGIPASVFATGEPRWLGVGADKAVAAPRALLVSVPYALTADDASKLGGLPVSAFVLKDETSAAKSSATPSGWKQAVDEEASSRAAADTTLQDNLDAEASSRAEADTTLQHALDAKSTELDTKLETEKTTRETKDTELHGKIDQTETELNTKIDVTKNELNTKIDVTKNELNTKIVFETSKLTTDQEAKLLALKNELKNDSSEKVNEIDQKKTGKEEFEQEKTKKQLDIDDLKLTKLSKAIFDQEKASKDLEINDLKEKKLSKAEYLIEKSVKEAELEDLRQRKLEKAAFDAEKIAKDDALKALDDKITAEKDRITTEKNRIDTLSRFVVSFSRAPNGADTSDAHVCVEPHVMSGIAVGQDGDPFGTAAPQCSAVSGAGIRADGILIGMLAGPVAMPGLDQAHIPPQSELACPAGHVVVGLVQSGGQMSAACRRLFSTESPVSSDESVTIGEAHPAQTCEPGSTAVGLRRHSGGIELICR